MDRHTHIRAVLVSLFTALLFCVPASMLHAASPQQNKAPATLLKANVSPQYLTDVNGTLFFFGTNGLWKSDGSETGTVLVKPFGPTTQIAAPQRLNPGPPTSAGLLPTAAGNLLFFVLDVGSNERQLWRSDGTAEGTFAVKTVQNGEIANLVALDGTLLFMANTELWRSDGSVAETTKVTNFDSLYVSTQGIVIGKTLFFVSGASCGLWKTDGTTQGTLLVKADLHPRAISGLCPYLGVNFNGTLFFSADTDEHGRELWKSDGTPEGTRLVKDFAPGPDSSEARPLAVANGHLFVSAVRNNVSELWTSDSTSGDFVKVTPASIGSCGVFSTTGGRLFFTAVFVEGKSCVLWQSDGTPGGTGLVKDIAPVRDEANDEPLANVYGELLFTTGRDSLYQGIWKSNGTAEGTVLLQDLPINGRALFTVSGGHIFFGSDFDLWVMPTMAVVENPLFLPLLTR